MVKDSSKTKLALFLVLLVMLCSAVSYLVSRWTAADAAWHHDQTHGHEWLREEIDLNDEEFAAINGYEADYRAERADLLRDFDAEMSELQTLLLNKDEFTPELQAAIHDLHIVHGALQELSIRHYFDMLGALPPEKRERLREIAAEALSQPE